VINGLMSGSKSRMSHSDEVSTLKLTRELHMENCNIELRERVVHHDCLVVVGIRGRALFVYWVNDMMRPC
jgi:hypothetical protein